MLLLRYIKQIKPIKMFNKYKWLEEQTESLTEYLQQDPEATYDDLHEKLLQDIDTDCIYYTNCFDIIKALGFTDWSDLEYEVKNVSQAAYCALYEFACEEIDIDAILKEAGNE